MADFGIDYLIIQNKMTILLEILLSDDESGKKRNEQSLRWGQYNMCGVEKRILNVLNEETLVSGFPLTRV